MTKRPANLNAVGLPFMALQQLGPRISPAITVLSVDITGTQAVLKLVEKAKGVGLPDTGMSPMLPGQPAPT